MHLLNVLTKLVAHLRATYVPLKRRASIVNCKLNLVFTCIYIYGYNNIQYINILLRYVTYDVLMMELHSKHIKTLKTKLDSKSNYI